MSEEKKQAVSRDERVMGVLAYLWVLCLLPLLSRKDSEFCQFHAKQGLVLFILEVLGWLIFWVPLVGWLLFIYIMVMAVLGIMNALQGNYWEMPALGKYARKINL